MNAIETDRLTLEPRTAAHAEEMFAVLGDPAIPGMNGGFRRHNDEGCPWNRT